MATTDDDWAVLGVPPGSSLDVARAAYLRRARALHPDRHPDATPAERARLDKAMAALNTARDRVGATGAPAAAPPPPPRRSARPPRPRRDDDLRPMPALAPVPDGFGRWGARARPDRWSLRLWTDDLEPLRLLCQGPAAAEVIALDLHRRPIHDRHVPLLTRLTALEALDLGDTKVTDAGLAPLPTFERLRHLVLAGNRITDAGLAALAGCRGLHSLVVGDSPITGVGLTALGDLPLTTLNLRGTTLDPDVLEVLATWPHLHLLALPHVEWGRGTASPGAARTSPWPEPLETGPGRGRGSSGRTVTEVRTHYEVLGVDHGAPLEEIKRAYYDRARRYHPDAHAGSSPAVRAEAERTMQALNSSWTILRDPVRRRRYDRALQRSDRGEEASGAGATAARGVAATRHRPPAASAAASGAATAATRPTRSRTPATQVRGRAALGPGFQHWFGSGALGPGTAGRRRGLDLRVTGASLAPLAALAPDGLVGLHAAHAAIGDDDLRHLAGIRSLRRLDLTATRVTDVGLVHLLACDDLEIVSLWDTTVTDDGLALLGRLPNLRHLGLGNTRVTDAGLRHLAGLRRLRLVQLAGTAVTGPGLRHLHGLPELASVSLPWKVGAGHRRRLRAALPAAALA